VVKVYNTSDGLPSNLMWFISGPQMKIACADRNRNLQIIGVDPWMTHSVLRPPPGLLERLDINEPSPVPHEMNRSSACACWG
jgi:hypothetical protein